MEHFPTPRMENLPDAKKLSSLERIQLPLLKIFEYEFTMKSFSVPFNLDVETFGRISEGVSM
jgi:hypothetical protein